MNVATCDRIDGVKTKRATRHTGRKPAAMELREAVALPGAGLSIPVRAAKARLSALLELVAGGQEVAITPDGAPKAVLTPVSKREQRKVFTGTLEHLKKMHPWRAGPAAQEIIREDLDGRGW